MRKDPAHREVGQVHAPDSRPATDACGRGAGTVCAASEDGSGVRGYLHVAVEIRPSPRIPRPGAGHRLRRLVSATSDTLRLLAADQRVLRVSAYRAVATPAARGRLPRRRGPRHRARFDLVLLVETVSAAAAVQLETGLLAELILDRLADRARQMHVMVAQGPPGVAAHGGGCGDRVVFDYLVTDRPAEFGALWYVTGGTPRQATDTRHRGGLLTPYPTAVTAVEGRGEGARPAADPGTDFDAIGWYHPQDAAPAGLALPERLPGRRAHSGGVVWRRGHGQSATMALCSMPVCYRPLPPTW